MRGRAACFIICALVCAGSCAAAKPSLAGSPAYCLSPPIEDELKVNCGFHCKEYPFKGSIGEHVGVDLHADEGTPVYAAASGTVIQAGSDSDDTNIVAVRTRRGWTYRVLHLKLYAVRKGDKVRRGQFLGRSGGRPGVPGSGKYTNGAHLHFDLTIGGTYVDPMPYFCPTP